MKSTNPRLLSLILLLLIATISFAQDKEIYRLTFSDRSNFSITTALRHKAPATLLIMDTTQSWNPNRFWLTVFNTKDKQKAIEEMKQDEHSVYNLYLFSDSALDVLFTDKMKQELSSAAQKIRSTHISLRGRGYRTGTSARRYKGFYFVTGRPIFTPDGQYAFIDLTVFHKDSYNPPANETWFGTVTIVYKKQGNTWKKIAKKDWLIL